MTAATAKLAAAAISPYSTAVAPESSLMKRPIVLMHPPSPSFIQLQACAGPDLLLSAIAPAMLTRWRLKPSNQMQAAGNNNDSLVNAVCSEP